jgi:peptidyl-prolyl cis-trans isomerase B (cyclophilin B)
LVTKQQRERQLARAKWERQQSRRNVRAARVRLLVITAWTAFGVGVAAVVVWFAATQLGNDNPAPVQGPPPPGLTPPLQPPDYSPPATPSGSAT